MRRVINVLHVIANLEAGGTERQLVKSLARFDHTSFSHKVCCVSGGGIYEDDLRALEIPYWIMKRHTRFDPSIVFQIARLMRRERVDVVQTLNFTANAWGRVAAKLAGVPRIIAYERGTAWAETAAMRSVDRLLYKITDLVLANSEAARIMLTNRINLPEDRIQVVLNGSMPLPETTGESKSVRGRLGIDAQTPLVGTVGRMDTPKGHIFLLDAIPLVWEQVPDVQFALIGDGPLRHYLEYKANELGLAETGKIHLPGFLIDAPTLLREMDLLVHPSIHDALSNVLIESGYAGLPVVASNVDGCPEIVLDGETGFLVKCTQPVTYVDAPGASSLPAMVVDGRTRQLRAPLGPSPEDLASAILVLLQDPHLRKQMGTRARARTEQLFSIQRYVRELENAYRGI